MAPPLVIFTTPFFVSGSAPASVADFDFDGSYYHDLAASAGGAVTRYVNSTTPSDSTDSTFSFWFRYYKHIDSVDIFHYIFSCNGGRALVRADGAGQFQVQLYNSSIAKQQDQVSDADTSRWTDESWHHFLYSRTGTTTHMYIDDVLQVGIHALNLGGATDWSGATIDIGAAFNSTFGWKGDLYGLYINSDEYIDFSVEANRRLFIDENGDPADLGPAGAAPTGTAPAVYFAEGNPLKNTGTLGGSFSLATGASILDSSILNSGYVSVVLADSPEAYWIMNEQSASDVATISDSSGNGFDATVSGSTHEWGWKPGPALNLADVYHKQTNTNAPQIFASSANFASIGAAGQEYTFECWLRTGNSVSQGGLIEKTDGVNNWNSLAVVSATGTARFQLLDNAASPSNPFVDAATDVTDTNWHHVVGMRTQTSGVYGEPSIKLYINGVLEGSTVIASTTDCSNSTNLEIGDRTSGNGASTLAGDMSHAAIYKTALNASQVLEHYNGMQGVFALSPQDTYASTIEQAAPIAWYRMNEASTGAGLIDDSGNGNNGTFIGASIVPVSGIPGAGSNLAATFASGIENPYSIMASGILSCASAAAPKTIECWYKGTENIGPLVTGRGGGGNPITGLYIGNAGILSVSSVPKFLVRADNNSGLKEATASTSTTTLVNDGTWHHIVGVLGGGGDTKGIQLYVDGEIGSSGVHTKNDITTTTRDWIGRDFQTNGAAPHQELDGIVDEVAIYDYALDASQILDHWEKGFPGASSYVNAVMFDSPVGYWRFSEGSGLTAADRSGNASSLNVASSIWSTSSIIDEGSFAIETTALLFAQTSAGDSPIADGAATFTMEIWFNKSVAPGGRQYLLALPEGAGSNGADIAIIGSTMEYRVNTTVGLVTATASPYPLASNNHAVLAYTGSAITGYLNGALVASTSHTGLLNHAYQRATIGNFSSSFLAGFTDGQLDEPALYDYALSASRILAHYEAGI